jgi:hypothetical protein
VILPDLYRQWLQRIARASLVAAVPVLLTVLFLHAFVGARLTHYQPVVSDEISYWHQIATARSHNVHGGRYTYEEQLPHGPSHFGAWGPAYPLIMAGLTSPISWQLSSPPRVALALFALALLVATMLTDPRGKRLVCVIAIVASFWPAYLALPTGLQEPFHLALATLLASCLVLMTRRRVEQKATRAISCCAVVLVITLACVRPVWAFMLLPALLLSRERITFVQVAAALAATAALALLALSWTVTMAAPYPYDSNPAIAIQAAHGLGGTARAIGSNMRTNWATLTGHRTFLTSFTATGLSAVVVLLGILIAFCRPARRRQSEGDSENDNEKRPRSARWTIDSVLVALGAFVMPSAVLFAGYSMGPSMRHLGPHILLMSVFVALRVPPRWLNLSLAAVVVSLVGSQSFHTDFRNEMTFRYSKQDVTGLDEAAKLIRYEKVDNPWCNTVLFATSPVFPPAMDGLPPGIGLGVTIKPTKIQLPLRSRWIILDRKHRTLPEGAYLRHRRLATPVGDLFENPDADC